MQEAKLSVFSPAYWRTARAEFRNVRVLAFAGLVCAMAIVLESLPIYLLGPSLKIYFSFLAVSPQTTKSTISHVDVLYVLVGTRFQVLFHSPPGVLFTFPSQYYTLSVIGEYLGLEGGPPVFPPGFTCPAVLWILMADLSFRIRDSHTLWLNFPFHSTNSCQYRTQSEPQKYYYSWFGLFRVRSPLLAESRLISFPLPT